MDSIARRFPYLVEQKPEDGDEDAQAAKIEWKIVQDDVEKPFVASALEFVPLPVTTSAVNHYFDLVTCLPPGVLTKIAILCAAISKSGAGQVDLLILEANSLHGVSLDAIKRIHPKRALLIGMRHFFEHQRENQMLAEWSIRYVRV
ncbi:unnamed protein product [Triticum turgidum subsp. durum]|uniref:Uncharacterized protein n=1 Tax=Triticum turgidum subsp. durum TaxID=4567 RepID=A0A9R0ZGL2_TRITD|nr:unnamed protein product [Triticum turgidum subsp. durum]